ncbi:AlpA family transcriptional regulator [Thioalkalivibrio sp. ALE9]|uniref:helix-turn-helix transcriptional regulator n=1 Tax=Thioalkalivibrio sp. ALE9 TaxID=1158169 RepID=UPI001E4B589C|nr:AlpA family phage regulatory protein [Thioalkalivibrio sp. ALE9]
MTTTKPAPDRAPNDTQMRLYGANERLLRLRDVLDRTATSRSAWYELIKKGQAPAPIKVGASARWVESEVNTWINQQIARG